MNSGLVDCEVLRELQNMEQESYKEATWWRCWKRSTGTTVEDSNCVDAIWYVLYLELKENWIYSRVNAVMFHSPFIYHLIHIGFENYNCFNRSTRTHYIYIYTVYYGCNGSQNSRFGSIRHSGVTVRYVFDTGRGNWLCCNVYFANSVQYLCWWNS